MLPRICVSTFPQIFKIFFYFSQDTIKEQPVEGMKPEATTPPGPTLKKVYLAHYIPLYSVLNIIILFYLLIKNQNWLTY